MFQANQECVPNEEQSISPIPRIITYWVAHTIFNLRLENNYVDANDEIIRMDNNERDEILRSLWYSKDSKSSPDNNHS